MYTGYCIPNVTEYISKVDTRRPGTVHESRPLQKIIQKKENNTKIRKKIEGNNTQCPTVISFGSTFFYFILNFNAVGRKEPIG